MEKYMLLKQLCERNIFISDILNAYYDLSDDVKSMLEDSKLFELLESRLQKSDLRNNICVGCDCDSDCKYCDHFIGK